MNCSACDHVQQIDNMQMVQGVQCIRHNVALIEWQHALLIPQIPRVGQRRLQSCAAALLRWEYHSTDRQNFMMYAMTKGVLMSLPALHLRMTLTQALFRFHTDMAIETMSGDL